MPLTLLFWTAVGPVLSLTYALPLIVVPTPEHVTPDGTVMLALIVCPEMLPVQDWVTPNASLETITPPLTTMNAEQRTARTRVLIRSPLVPQFGESLTDTFSGK